MINALYQVSSCPNISYVAYSVYIVRQRQGKGSLIYSFVLPGDKHDVSFTDFVTQIISTFCCRFYILHNRVCTPSKGEVNVRLLSCLKYRDFNRRPH